MSKNLRERVIAEGVDTDEQLAFLQARQHDDEHGLNFSDVLWCRGLAAAS